jgi:hypothetical protein
MDQHSFDPPASTTKAKVLSIQAAAIMNQNACTSHYINTLTFSTSAGFMICGDCSEARINQTNLAAQVEAYAGGIEFFSKST